jgi:DNA-binding MarR family transcriptional regulator
VNGDMAARAAQDVELVLRVRRARSEIFGPELFSDPAWDILLQLFEAGLRGRKLRLTDVAADVPPSTLARWAAALEERGLIRCESDPIASSTLWLTLSPSGELKMSGVLARLHELHPVA